MVCMSCVGSLWGSRLNGFARNISLDSFLGLRFGLFFVLRKAIIVAVVRWCDFTITKHHVSIDSGANQHAIKPRAFYGPVTIILVTAQ